MQQTDTANHWRTATLKLSTPTGSRTAEGTLVAKCSLSFPVISPKASPYLRRRSRTSHGYGDLGERADDRRGFSGPNRLNPGVTHNAGVWNYWPGGKDPHPADRVMGDPMSAVTRRVCRCPAGCRGRRRTRLKPESVHRGPAHNGRPPRSSTPHRVRSARPGSWSLP